MLALPSPTGGEILYHAWEGSLRGAGVPVLRIHSSGGDPERVLVRGGQSAAWRRDGAVAYMRATPDRYVPRRFAALDSGGNYGQVVVRASAQAPPVRWTKEQRRRYVVLGWARFTLLVQIEPSHLLRDRRPPGIYALAAAGPLRALPLRELCDPAGRRSLDPPAPAASDRQRTVAARCLRPVPLPACLRGGDRHVVTLVATHDAEERIVFAGFLTCDRRAGRCVRGRNLTPGTTWATVIDNPSRPEPGRG